MRIRSIVTVALLSIMPASAAAAEDPGHRAGINARQQRQAARVRDGVQDGAITRAESNRLRADEATIRAEERVYRHSGDGLTRPERRDLERDLNRTSREIGRAKHNHTLR